MASSDNSVAPGGRRVDTVLIGGRYRKRDGVLVYPQALLRQRMNELLESAAWLMNEAEFRVAA